MDFRTLIGQGLRALGRNRLRSALTILGISIAIAAVVCVVAIGNAGSAGVLLGVLGTASLGRIRGWPTKRSIEALITAALFLIGGGLFFGYYPARKAAKLDPVEVLRFE